MSKSALSSLPQESYKYLKSKETRRSCNTVLQYSALLDLSLQVASCTLAEIAAFRWC